MSTLADFTLYHSPGSRSGRTKMMLDLLALPYTLVPMDMRAGEHKDAAYLAINPYGVVPTLKHGSRVILESAAQVMYLAEADPTRALAPPVGTPERATYYEMFVLAPSVIEPTVGHAWRHPDAPESAKAIHRALSLYDQRFTGPYFLGTAMTALDVFLHWGLRFFPEDVLEEFSRIARYRRHMDQQLDWSTY
ncbi:MAG: glutathione S-transferase family protein [Pseudomonadota bacterium]